MQYKYLRYTINLKSCKSQSFPIKAGSRRLDTTPGQPALEFILPTTELILCYSNSANWQQSGQASQRDPSTT